MLFAFKFVKAEFGTKFQCSGLGLQLSSSESFHGLMLQWVGFNLLDKRKTAEKVVKKRKSEV